MPAVQQQLQAGSSRLAVVPPLQRRRRQPPCCCCCRSTAGLERWLPCIAVVQIGMQICPADLCDATGAPLLQTCVAYPTSDVTIATHQVSWVELQLTCENPSA